MNADEALERFKNRLKANGLDERRIEKATADWPNGSINADWIDWRVKIEMEKSE